MALTLRSFLRTRRGVEMPVFGLGTWLSESDECKSAVDAAVRHGIKLIDTATMYKNEAEVGEALADAPDVFVVTKLQPQDHGREAALAALDASLSKLRRPCVDLWLMHSPSGGRVVETWRAMCEARDSGKCRAVGVSNFGPGQLRGLAESGCELPEVNQFELHPWHSQAETVGWCRENGVVVMSFCPLGRTKLFGKTSVAEIAAAAGCSEAQLCCRYLLQKGYVVIPKSSSPERVVQNAAAIELAPLDEDTMRAIDDLGEQTRFYASNAAKSMDLPWEQVR